MDGSDLKLNFAEFCFEHFEHNEAAIDDKYQTPLGSKDNSPNGNESESIEVVVTPSAYRGPLQESTISSASTNNTDICILDSHYTSEDIQFLPEPGDEIENQEVDEFVQSEDGDDVFLRSVDVMDKDEDFTVLKKPIKTCHICNCEESTEALIIINSEYKEKRKHTYSGTDSDVEVLMSEEIIESDWSSGNGLEQNANDSNILRKTSNVLNINMDAENEVCSPSLLKQSYDVSSFKRQSSTDVDISEELIDAGKDIDKYHNFNRVQLLQLIKKQELCIQALEATVERYQKAQERLFEHVDALRLELSEIRITPSQVVEK